MQASTAQGSGAAGVSSLSGLSSRDVHFRCADPLLQVRPRALGELAERLPRYGGRRSLSGAEKHGVRGQTAGGTPSSIPQCAPRDRSGDKSRDSKLWLLGGKMVKSHRARRAASPPSRKKAFPTGSRMWLVFKRFSYIYKSPGGRVQLGGRAHASHA